jgi:transcriptional regulator GlxA family with amidase domain
MHRNHLHPAVHRVQDAVRRNPAASWKAPELAAIACTSIRNLSRLFTEHAGCTPLDYVQLIRFALARQLVTQSRLDLGRIALRSGFHSAQQLRRVWSRWEAQPPSAFRNAEASTSRSTRLGPTPREIRVSG